MKNLFFLGLATTAIFASCSSDETIDEAQQKAIGFSTFVNKATRSVTDPSYDQTKLQTDGFAVYGFKGNDQIFNGTKVSGENWEYSPLQYWITDNTYTFSAVAPYDLAVTDEKVEGEKVTMKVANFTNDGETDFLHATSVQVSNVTPNYNDAVHFNFYHQLSKVKFTFTNNVGEDYYVTVKDLKITDAKKTGTWTCSTIENSWTEQDGKITLDFGNVATASSTATDHYIANGNKSESYYERLMIPTANADYTVTFKVTLYLGESHIQMAEYSHEVTISGQELKLGNCYNFKAELTMDNITGKDDDKPQPITFTAEVKDWTPSTYNEAEIDGYQAPATE